MTARQPWPDASAMVLVTVMAGIEPGLGGDAVLQALALAQAAARPDGRRRIAEAVTTRPELLTGEGARAGLGVLRFIRALLQAGAVAVFEPVCPSCGNRRPLGSPVEGLRVCTSCLMKSRALTCGRCGKLRSTQRRNDGGQPICQACWWRDPRGWKTCVGCGNSRRVAAITKDGPCCQSCRPRPDLPCGICGSTNRIGISEALGAPVCDRCRKRWIICSACGTGATLKGGTPEKPLCARCLNPDPDFWDRCGVCQRTWQLSTAECTRCCLGRNLTEILTAPAGAVAPELDRLRQALLEVDRPDNAVTWLTRPSVRSLLRDVASGHRALTHEVLDAMPPSGTLKHLRSMLVAVGAIEPRDERLTALERWVHQTATRREIPEHRRALHGYAVWHLLRRLRGRLDGQAATHQQVKQVRQHVTAAAALLDWLEGLGLNLAGCTQNDLDRWLIEDSGPRTRSRPFVRWAVTNRHATALTAPSSRWTGPSGPIDQDRRWDDARRLLHDGTHTTADRVAGLLVLLYAQKLNIISTLTTGHVHHDADGRTLLRLGTRPVELPTPLDGLVDELLATRRAPGSGLITTDSDWLFPGRWPGRPMTEDSLARRLHTLGLNPRQSRNTALFALAAEIPAAILAKTLGINIKGAIQWQKISAGDWTAYAADVGRRGNT